MRKYDKQNHKVISVKLWSSGWLIHKNTARTISIFAEMQHHIMLNQNKLNKNAQVLHILYFFCMSNSKPQIQHIFSALYLLEVPSPTPHCCFFSFVIFEIFLDIALRRNHRKPKLGKLCYELSHFLSLCFNLWFFLR